MNESSRDDSLQHHKRFEYCYNRLKYRNGRKPTAVKVNLYSSTSHNKTIIHR